MYISVFWVAQPTVTLPLQFALACLETLICASGKRGKPVRVLFFMHTSQRGTSVEKHVKDV